MTAQDLLARTERVGECRIWPGVKANGYAIVRIQRRVRRVSRLMWELIKGPIPAGLLVCHECDDPRCIAIEHLFLGNHRTNYRDMMSKGRGRGPIAERTAGLCYIRRDEVEDILARAGAGEALEAIAKSYRLPIPAVARVIDDPAFHP